MSSSTALEEMHHIPLHIRIGRARAGVLFLILSDSLSVVALLAAGGYLNTLNTESQFKLSTDQAPAFLPGLLVAIGLLLSGLAFYWWEQRTRKNTEGRENGQPIFFILSWVLMVAALIGQILVATHLGYSPPFHAYASLILLLTWYSVVHLALAAVIGILLFGRIVRSRLVNQGYLAEVTGYWWYYTVIASLLMWAFTLAVK